MKQGIPHYKYRWLGNTTTAENFHGSADPWGLLSAQPGVRRGIKQPPLLFPQTQGLQSNASGSKTVRIWALGWFIWTLRGLRRAFHKGMTMERKTDSSPMMRLASRSTVVTLWKSGFAIFLHFKKWYSNVTRSHAHMHLHTLKRCMQCVKGYYLTEVLHSLLV